MIPTHCKYYYYVHILAFATLRWLHEWPKHVCGHYIIKLHHKTKVNLLVFNKFYTPPVSSYTLSDVLSGLRGNTFQSCV